MVRVIGGDKLNIEYQGRMIEVDRVEFIERKEGWNEYQLTNGKVLRIKLIATTIFKAKTELDQAGNPLYIIQSQNVIAPVE